MSPAWQQNFRWIGRGLALAGIAFVALRLYEYRGSLDISQISSAAWVAMAWLAILYGAANLLLALAWWKLLAQFGVQVTLMWAIKVYSVSQLAKYVPGNIFHLAGRQAIGMAAGASSRAMVKSMLWELGLIAVAGILYGWLVLPALLPWFPALASNILLMVTVCIVAYLVRRWIGLQVSVSFGWLMVFLAVSGGVFVILLDVIANTSKFTPQTWLLIGASYIIAWLAGLVTPGAPAGVGVRELILLLLLNGFVKDADLLIALMLGRLITVLGDILFFILSFLIPDTLCQIKKDHE